MLRAAALLILAARGFHATAAVADEPPPPDLARGSAIYAGQCAICHGQRGEGGRGAILARPKLRLAQNEANLQQIIRRGIAGKGMPGTWLNEAELRDVAAHVLSLGRVDSAPVPGDPSRGKTLFQGPSAACAGCHTIDGRGGAFGPDLTGIGSRRSAAHLRASILDPVSDVPADFVLLRATLQADGRVIAGARVNEDTFSVQLRDASGKVHSFWKTELRALDKQPGKTAMPPYQGKLSGSDLDDLIAYLVSLQEEPAQ